MHPQCILHSNLYLDLSIGIGSPKRHVKARYKWSLRDKWWIFRISWLSVDTKHTPSVFTPKIMHANWRSICMQLLQITTTTTASHTLADYCTHHRAVQFLSPFKLYTKELWLLEIKHFSFQSMFSCSCVIHWRWEGAAAKVHQPLLPARQDVPLPSVDEPCGHPTGLFLWSALYGGRAHCEWVCACVKRQLLWAALSLGWQSPLSSNPLDPLPFHSEP